MPDLNSKNWLNLKRIVRFGDTDAAGVIHFYNLFRWCHEAWEESLECFGVKPTDVFPSCRENIQDPDIALPLVNCKHHTSLVD